MPKLIPFPARHVQEAAAYALALTVRLERLNKPTLWTSPPAHPERLGNMLQRLARKRPAAVLVFESIVAEMLELIES